MFDFVGHPLIALGHFEQARAVWREALELYRAQQRSADADRIQQQLNTLNGRPCRVSTTVQLASKGCSVMINRVDVSA